MTFALKPFVTHLALAAILSSSSLAMAQSSTKKDLVQRLLTVQQPEIETIARRLAEQPAAQLAGGAQQVLAQAVPVEKREATAKQVDDELKKYLDQAVPLVRDRASKAATTSLAPMLEEKFTEEELKQLVAFFESPVRKKYQQAMPEMNEAMLKKLVEDARPLVDPKLQAAQANIRKILETAAGRPLGPASGAESGSSSSTSPAAKPATKPAPKKPASQ